MKPALAKVVTELVLGVPSVALVAHLFHQEAAGEGK